MQLNGLMAMLLTAGGTLALGACVADAPVTPEPASEPTVETTSGPIAAPDLEGLATPAAPDAKACEAQGGFIDRRGMMGTEMCVHPYPDGGQPCRDNLECAGKCIAPVDDGPSGEIVGECQADDALFGCYSEVVDGKLVRAICVD